MFLYQVITIINIEKNVVNTCLSSLVILTLWMAARESYRRHREMVSEGLLFRQSIIPKQTRLRHFNLIKGAFRENDPRAL